MGIDTMGPSRKLDIAGKVTALLGVEFELSTEEYPEKGLIDNLKTV